MKTFIITRVGMMNSDEDFLLHNLDLFSAITFPSMEKAINSDDIYWLLLISKNFVPVKVINQLNQMIDNSPIRKNIYLILNNSVNVWDSNKRGVVEFITQHIEKGEYYLKHWIDTDDAVRFNLFDKAKEFVLDKIKEKGKDFNFCFSFGAIFSYYLRENKIECFKNRYYQSYNSFTYENGVVVDSPHILSYSREANIYIKENFEIFEVMNTENVTLYTLHGSNNISLRGVYVRKDGFNDLDLLPLEDFGIYQENVNRYLIKYPDKFRYRERYSNAKPFTNQERIKRQELDKIYELARQALDPNDLEKKEIRDILKDIQIKNGTNFYDTIISFYELPNKCPIELKSINQSDDYLSFLEKHSDKYYYFISAKRKKCFGLACANRETPIIKTDEEVFIQSGFKYNKIYSSFVYIVSRNINNTLLSSIEVKGLEYSMNLDGLNVVVANPEGFVVDSVNISDDGELRR